MLAGVGQIVLGHWYPCVGIVSRCSGVLKAVKGVCDKEVQRYCYGCLFLKLSDKKNLNKHQPNFVLK